MPGLLGGAVSLLMHLAPFKYFRENVAAASGSRISRLSVEESGERFLSTSARFVKTR